MPTFCLLTKSAKPQLFPLINDTVLKSSIRILQHTKLDPDQLKSVWENDANMFYFPDLVTLSQGQGCWKHWPIMPTYESIWLKSFHTAFNTKVFAMQDRQPAGWPVGRPASNHEWLHRHICCSFVHTILVNLRKGQVTSQCQVPLSSAQFASSSTISLAQYIMCLSYIHNYMSIPNQFYAEILLIASWPCYCLLVA